MPNIVRIDVIHLINGHWCKEDYFGLLLLLWWAFDLFLMFNKEIIWSLWIHVSTSYLA